MANGQTFQYDVFLSYSSQDELWATGLFDELKAQRPALRVFQDRQGMIAGEPWEPQVRAALRDSKHLLVLWSQQAKASNWVTREVTIHEQSVNPGDPAPRAYDRLTMIVLLEDDKTAFESLHMNRMLSDAGEYAKGFAGRDQALWGRCVTKVLSDIDSASPSRPIRLAVLAMTDTELAALDAKRQPTFVSVDFATMLDRLSLKDHAALQALNLYGKTRADWKPFGKADSIETILQKVAAQFNQQANLRPIRWEPVGPDFWGNNASAAIREGKKLVTQDPSVVVVDPLSLYHPAVQGRLGILEACRCFKHPECLILVLSPFPMPDPVVLLRDELWNLGTPQLTTYNGDPVVDIEAPFAGFFFLNMGDDLEIRRLLRLSLGTTPVPVAKPGAAEYTVGSFR